MSQSTTDSDQGDGDRGGRLDHPTTNGPGRLSLRPPEPQPDSDTSLLDVAKERMGTILGSLLILVAIGIYAGWEPRIPSFWEVYGLSFLFLLPAGWMAANYSKQYFADSQDDWVVDLDARATDGALARFPGDSLRDAEVTDGQMCQLAPSLYTAREVDLALDANGPASMVGTWRGTLSDRELLIALEAVYQCRGQLEDQARRGFALETRFHGILRNTTRSQVLDIVRTFEQGSLPDDASSLHKHIEAALEDHGLENQIHSSADDFDIGKSFTEYSSSDDMVGSARQNHDGPGGVSADD